MTKKADYIWFNGEMVPWAEAKVHVMSHALHYGTSVFEGALLRLALGAGSVPSSRAYAAPARFGENLPHAGFAKR